LESCLGAVAAVILVRGLAFTDKDEPRARVDTVNLEDYSPRCVNARDEPVAFKPRPHKVFAEPISPALGGGLPKKQPFIGVARNGLQDKAQRFGPALKVSEDAAAILLLILVGSWIPVAHAMPECVVK